MYFKFFIGIFLLFNIIGCDGDSGEDNDSGNHKPIVNAGRDKNVNVNENITIIGVATDSDGTIVSYEWKEGSQVLSNTDTVYYIPTIEGNHILTLTVTDDDGATSSDNVNIIAKEEIDSTTTDSPQIKRGTGLIFSSKESLEEMRVATPPVVYGSSSLPKSFDLSSLMPPVRSQGSQGSCVAWAVGYYLKSYHEHIEQNTVYGKGNNHSGTFSPAFLYNITKLKGCYYGSYFEDNFERLKNVGVSSWDDMPYNENDCNTLPSQKAIKNAKCAKILKYEILNTSIPLETIDLMDIKNYLVKKEPITIGIKVYNGFDYPQKFNGEYFYKNYTGKGDGGGHAIIVVGYDDHKNAFKIVNSWGTYWGNSGYLWIDYEVFKKIVFVVFVAHDAKNSCEEGSSYLSINKASLMFKDKLINKSYQKTFTMSNVGTADFYVSDIVTPDGYSVSWKNGTVQAGMSKSVVVTFRPTEKKQYNGTLTIKHNAEKGNNQITLVGAGITKPNKPPVANAGSDVTVEEDDLVSLSGANSSDSDGDIVAYKWKEGNTILSESKTFQKSNFSVGIHRITLTITDNEGAIDTDTVVVTIKSINKPPIANAGSDITANEGNTVNLSGAKSTDSDGNIVSYEWKEENTLLSESRNFQKRDFSLGIHRVTLKVTDDDGATSKDTVVITITSNNKPPVANAGNDITAEQGINIEIDASKSTDSDGDIVSYEWWEGTQYVTKRKTFISNSFSIGIHTLTLKVTDNDGATSTDTVVITITSNNKPPVANAGNDITAEQGTSIEIDASKSTDSDGNIVSYEWWEGTQYVTKRKTFISNSFSIGIHTLTLKVTDNDGATSTDTVIVTIKEKDTLNNAFITIWKTDNEGEGNNNQIKINTSGSNINYNIDWGDGTNNTSVHSSITHTYQNIGTYTIKITGKFPRLYQPNHSSSNNKLLSVEQWGDIKWESMSTMFSDCYNLCLNATDKPNLSNVTNMSAMFATASSNCSNRNSWDISDWDVSNVSNMSAMFERTPLNLDISDWDVSHVTNMSGMFFSSKFNQDISSWTVSNVTDTSFMFATSPFNQNISNWNTSNVIYMEWMFAENEKFNQDISHWNVSNVKQMERMFDGALGFSNHDLSGWDVSSVISHKYFAGWGSGNTEPNWN